MTTMIPINAPTISTSGVVVLRSLMNPPGVQDIGARFQASRKSCLVRWLTTTVFPSRPAGQNITV